jgi:hypothetical protein
MIDIYHDHTMTLFIDTVTNPVLTPPGSPYAFERRAKSYAHNSWSLKEWAGHKLPGGKRDRWRKVLAQRPSHTR